MSATLEYEIAERVLAAVGDQLPANVVAVAVRSPLDCGEPLDALATLTNLIADAAIPLPVELIADIKSAVYYTEGDSVIANRAVDRLATFADRLISP